MKATDENIVVYHLDSELLKERIKQLYPYKKDGDYYEVSNDGIIMVNGGYLLVSHDCCYSLSITELRSSGGNNNVVERFQINVSVNRKQGNKTTYNMLNFFYNMDCAILIKKYSQKTSSLKDFMGSLYNYNPRVNKNMNELISLINETI